MDSKPEVGHSFSIVDERNGRSFHGWASTLDGAIADALHQLNLARAAEFCVVARLREYVNGDAL